MSVVLYPLLLIFCYFSLLLSTAAAQTPSSPLNVSIFADGNCSVPLSTIQPYPTYEYWASLVSPASVISNWTAFDLSFYDQCATITYNLSSVQVSRSTVFTCIVPNSTAYGVFGKSGSGYLYVLEFAVSPTIPPCRNNPSTQTYGTGWTSFNTCLPFALWTEPRGKTLRNQGSIIVHSCPTSPPIPPPPPPHQSTLSAGDIAAITISVVLVVCFVMAGLCYYRRRVMVSVNGDNAEVNGGEKQFTPLRDG